MAQTNSPSAHPDPPPIVSLPYALYDSHGLLFELYQGGQPPKHHEISWVRLQPMHSPDRSESLRGPADIAMNPFTTTGETSVMATTDNLQILPSAPNREFALQVLRHMRADGTPVYTIGIWEEGLLRCISHAHPIATALVALSREFEGSGADASEYPRWSEIVELVSRLENSADADCTAAAAHLGDLHSRLHNTTAELDLTKERLTQFGAMLEDAASRSRVCYATVALPQDAWFGLLSFYRVRQEGQELYTELRALRELAGITAETLRTVDEWLGQASTREAAMDALWRLRRILERVGFKTPLEHLKWRGQIVRALEEAGLGVGADGAIRVRQPKDKYWQPATGPLVREVLQNA